ncbi:tetratricopeptide repeat-containing sensor histidine kinase [Lutibacter sp.]
MKLVSQIFIVITLFFVFSNTLKGNNLSLEDKKLYQIKELLEKGSREKALTNLYQFINEITKGNDTLLIVEAKMLLADVLRDNGDFLKSNIKFNEVVPLLQYNYKKLQSVYFKIGGNFQRNGNIEDALINYKKALSVSNKIDSFENEKAKIHANISGIYYLKANYDKAIEHSKIAAGYQKFLGNKDIEAGILNNLGSIYYMQGNYKEALETFQKALKIVGFGQEKIQKNTRNSSYINIAYAYSGLKKYKQAFEYQDKYFSLNDSLMQEYKYKEIAEIESKYNIEAKEKEAKFEKDKREKAELLSYGLGFTILILLGGIYSLYRGFKLNKKNHMLQTQQKQLVYQNKVNLLKSETQSKILVATLDGRLEERKQIATVLHDNISALLTAANMHLYVSKTKLKDNAPKEIEKSQDIISEASKSIRSLSHKLISSVLLKFGLEVAVKDLCEKSSNSEIQLNSKAINITRFDQNFELKMLNNITELVNNILKHSKATKGSVKIEQLNGNLNVTVLDNGLGFNIDEVRTKSGIGLSQIEARIKAMGGFINYSTNSNGGAHIYISVPIVY